MKILALSFFVLILSPQLLLAGDDYEPEVIVSCGNDSTYRSTPLFHVELTVFEHAEIQAVLMGYSSFSSNGVSTVEGCRVTNIRTEEQTIVFSNPLQNCSARLDYNKAVDQVRVLVPGKSPLENCKLSMDPKALIERIRNFDPSIRFQ